MAESRGRGDERGVRGQPREQSGSKRPRPKTGSATASLKKGDVPPKGTRREGAAKKTTPER
jgi:hypothetical protein